MFFLFFYHIVLYSQLLELVDEDVPVLAREHELLAAYSETVERSGVQKGLKSLSVDYSGHPLHKVEDICKLAVFFAFCEDCTHDVVSESLDSVLLRSLSCLRKTYFLMMIS